MTVIWKGTKAVTLSRVERVWKIDRGWQSTYYYSGGWDEIEAAKSDDTYVEFAAEIIVKRNGPSGELIVIFEATDNTEPPQNDEDSNTWTLTPYVLQKNIEEHPRYVVLADNATVKGFLQRILLAVERYKAAVETGINLGNTDKDLVFNLSDYITYTNAENSNITTTEEALAAELAELLLRGHTSYNVPKYTVRQVKVVPSTSNLSANHRNVDRQWSTIRLTEEMASGTPGVTNYAIIGDIANEFTTSRWLKAAPQVNQLNNGKFEIINEWVQYDADELPAQIYPTYD